MVVVIVDVSVAVIPSQDKKQTENMYSEKKASDELIRSKKPDVRHPN